MKLESSGAPARAVLASLVLGCAAQKVSGPPAPPPYVPPAAPAAAEKAAPAPSATDAGPAAEPAAPTQAPAREQEAKQEPPAPAEKKKPPLGWVAGQPLEPEELLLEWGDAAPRELFLVVDKLVAAHLAMAEAARLGIRLDPAEVERRAALEKEKLEQEIARSKNPRPPDEFIRRELGLEPGPYLERLRRATIRQMLAERAVRASSLASESAAVRLIVVPEGEKLAAVQAALAAGRDFGDVAREFSVDDSKAQGGLVPFVVREERSPLAALAFRSPVGEVAGPMPVADHQFLLRVEEKRTPLEGDWKALEAAVEASLREHPVETSEFVHWKLETQGRYPIDMGPLWSLIGKAR